MKQFCLLSYEDPIFSIPLFDEKIPGGNPNVTVIIGPNGSGKSRILSAVVDEFCLLNGIRGGVVTHNRKLRLPSHTAKLRYRLAGKECQIIRNGYETECTVDNEWVDIGDVPFPKRIAAVSHLPSDRFRFAHGEDSSFYRYLGLRQSTNLTTTRALETKVLQSLLFGFSQSGFSTRFETWLNLAGFSNDIGIDMVLASRDLLTDNFDDFKVTMVNIDKRRMGGRARTTPEAAHEEALKVWNLFRVIRHLNWREDRRPSCAYRLSHLLSEPESAIAWLEGYDLARRWRLFHSINLLMSKSGRNLVFSDLSSGEQQLIGTSARLLAELESDSLVIIDEPEVSLHPEWQIKYIPTLRDCLSAMSAMHIMIATHSHFMVSDLGEGDSSLVTTSDEGGTGITLFDGAVYGRSPENILYRVFGVATAGNAYVESDLYRALRMISNAVPIDLDELSAIYRRLEKVRGKDNAAMNVILGQVSEALEARQ
jgi:predicted ATPase